jgi:hypothetical protein
MLKQFLAQTRAQADALRELRQKYMKEPAAPR